MTVNGTAWRMTKRAKTALKAVLGPRAYRWAAVAYHPLKYRMARYQRRTPAPELALKWLRTCEIHVNPPGESRWDMKGIADVVPTLLRYGERAMAANLAQQLIARQRPDGSYANADGAPALWDTAHVLRGLLSAGTLTPEARSAAIQAAEYVCREMTKPFNGEPRPQEGRTQTVCLYVLATLKRAADILDRPEYRDTAQRWLDQEEKLSHDMSLSQPTHLLTHQCEALLDLGQRPTALKTLNALQEAQAKDGTVAARQGASWICAAGLAHLALCWYEVGNWESADKALEWLEGRQGKTGGFRGGYGRGISPAERAESLLAAKFYLDANRRRVIRFMDRMAGTDVLPSEVSEEDGRTQAILQLVQPGDRVLEAGCGKGRFLKRIRQRYPDAQCVGADICAALLQELPPEIPGVEGSLECIPFPDNSFDVVFSVEAMEHSSNKEAAVREMIRVARPGGWVAIIDKQKSHRGRLKCPVWESWPDARGLEKTLRLGCLQVTFRGVSYGHFAADGLMVLWQGRKKPAQDERSR